MGARATVQCSYTCVKKVGPLSADGRAARREATHRRLLERARAIVERDGASHLTVTRLADAGGVTRRTVYDHFGSRAGLLLALVDRVDRDADLGARVEFMQSAPSGFEALARFVELVSQVTPGLFELATALERARFDDPDVDIAWEDRMAGRMNRCREIAQRLHDEQVLRPDLGIQTAADLIYAAIAWQQWQLLVVERGWTPTQWRNRTTTTLRRALTVPNE